jgi:hypothetical protein
MPPRWSPEPWKYLNGTIYLGPLPHEQMIAVVLGGTEEENDANGRLMAAAPEAARLLAAAYPYSPMPLREQIHAWFSMVGATLEDFKDGAPPPSATGRPANSYAGGTCQQE